MSAKSAVPTRAGSNRLVEATVVAEPLLAVSLAKSMVVWKIASGVISLTKMKPPVSGS